MQTPQNYDGLDEATVLALGRVAWAAINVEDRATSMCEHVLGGFRGKESIGPFIDRAVASLESQASSSGATGVITWLGLAKDALITRNAIMHSVPVSYTMTQGTFLSHIPNRGGSAVITPLEAVHLDAVADEFVRIYSAWAAVLSAYSAERVQAPDQE